MIKQTLLRCIAVVAFVFIGVFVTQYFEYEHNLEHDSQNYTNPSQTSSAIKKKGTTATRNKGIASIDSSLVNKTSEKVVADHLKTNKKLPNYYITKPAAQASGWVASQGNLCDVLPGRAIGGDYFGNREGLLPRSNGRKYFEADISYGCGHRGAHRIVYSNDGLIFVTHNHYKNFQQIP